MAYTSTDLSNLKKALASGAQSTSVAGRSVNFRTVEELQALIALVEAELNAADPTKPKRVRRVTASFIRKPSRW